MGRPTTRFSSQSGQTVPKRARMRGKRRVEGITAIAFPTGEDEVVEVGCDLLRGSVPNRPHCGYHSTVSRREHPRCEMDSFVRYLLVARARLTGRQESEVGVLEIRLEDGTKLKRTAVEDETALEWLCRILRSVACEMDAAEVQHALDTAVHRHFVSFELQNPHSVLLGSGEDRSYLSRCTVDRGGTRCARLTGEE